MPDKPTEERDLSKLWHLLVPVIAPTTVIAALMVYFGWARVSVMYSEFGLVTSTLDLPIQDYLFYSPASMFRPLAILLITVVILAPCYTVLISWLAERPSVARRAALGMLILGLVLSAHGLLGGLWAHFYGRSPVLPMSLFLGVLLFGFAIRLRDVANRRPLIGSPLLRVVWTGAFVGTIVLTLLWSGAVHAQNRAYAELEELMKDPRVLPSAVVYTPERLHIAGEGVTESRLRQRAGEPARYRYRYDGLRLLIHTNDRYFLVPTCWAAGTRHRAIAIPDESSVRLEFFRTYGERPPACP